MTAGRRSGLLTAFSALTLFAVAGCAELIPEGPAGPAPPPPPPPPTRAAPQGIVINSPFKADDFAWSVRPGTARIQGLTAPGASCAGNAVALTPATPYSSERIRALYGSNDYAVLPIEVVRSRTIINDNPAMRGYVNATRCDATGAFFFDKKPAGPYFIIAEVNDASGKKVIMRRVTAVAGRTLQVPLNGPAPPPPPAARKRPAQG
ncbi:MAG TPA: hypothetical protein VGM25_01075 [Caulobacteraceae bacterium]|jgi:hypothetical protein